MPAVSGSLQQLIRAKLLESTDVTDLIGDRVFGHHFEDPENGTPPMPLLIVELVGGSVMYNREVSSNNVEIWSYSQLDADEASELYDAAWLALQGERLSLDNVGTVGLAREINRPTSGYNSQIRAWYARGRWIIHAAG